MPDDTQSADNWIDQACAIPLRRCADRIEVCLITSVSKGRWGFPKGIIESGETAEQTARMEAAEEAGLFGEIVGPPLGSYRYNKWGTTLIVSVYLMAVTRTAPNWVEADLRQRQWIALEEAYDLLYRAEHRELLNKAIERWDTM